MAQYTSFKRKVLLKPLPPPLGYLSNLLSGSLKDLKEDNYVIAESYLLCVNDTIILLYPSLTSQYFYAVNSDRYPLRFPTNLCRHRHRNSRT